MIDCEFMSCMGDDDLVVDAARVSFNKQAGNYSDSQGKNTTPHSPIRTLRFAVRLNLCRNQLAKHQVGGTSHI